MPEFPSLDDVKAKLTEPMLPTMLANFLLAVLTFSMIANARTDTNNTCGFAEDEAACSFAFGTSFTAFVFSSALIACELYWERFERYHRQIYWLETAISATYAGLFFIAFCVLASKWGETPTSVRASIAEANAKTAIATTFFSCASWGVLAFFARKAYKDDSFASDADAGEGVSSYLDPVTSVFGGESGGPLTS